MFDAQQKSRELQALSGSEDSSTMAIKRLGLRFSLSEFLVLIAVFTPLLVIWQATGLVGIIYCLTWLFAALLMYHALRSSRTHKTTHILAKSLVVGLFAGLFIACLCFAWAFAKRNHHQQLPLGEYLNPMIEYLVLRLPYSLTYVDAHAPRWIEFASLNATLGIIFGAITGLIVSIGGMQRRSTTAMPDGAASSESCPTNAQQESA